MTKINIKDKDDYIRFKREDHGEYTKAYQLVCKYYSSEPGEGGFDIIKYYSDKKY